VTGDVAVVGTVNRDIIVAPDGRERTSLGGILYNVLSLAALLEGTGRRVRAIGRLGAEDRAEALALLEGFQSADRGGLAADPAGTNRSRLDYSAPGERVETVEMRVAPLTEADLVPAQDTAAVLVNMISGNDVAIEAVEALRARSSGFFALDVQALARTTATPRRPRAVPEWERWAGAFDLVRGNDSEIGWMAGSGGDVEAGMDRLLAAGAREVIVTRGEEGGVRAEVRAGRVRRDRFPARSAGPLVDPTGCGDSFLSGVVGGRLLGLGSGASVRLGAWVAGQVATLAGLEALRGLSGLRERAAAADPAFAVLAARGGPAGTESGAG